MAPASMGARVRAFLSRRPVLCLLLLTPGIVEYLSGSSQLSLLLLSPPLFFLILAANLGLYGSGVLLIREARVRWKAGWGTVLLLGAAYGILEEGIAVQTLFYPHATPVGAFGFYGHWLGVSWVWTSELLIVHALWSIALPILLLELALPDTRGKSLLRNQRQVETAFALLSLDVLVLLLETSAIYHFYTGPVLWAGSVAAIGALVYLARRCPRDLLRPITEVAQAGPLRFFLVGAALLPALLVAENLMLAVGGAPVLAVLAVEAIAGLELAWVLKNVGRERHEPQLVAFGAGLVAPLMFLGFVSQLSTGVGLIAVLGGNVASVLFFRHLWQKHAPPAKLALPTATGLAGLT